VNMTLTVGYINNHWKFCRSSYFNHLCT